MLNNIPNSDTPHEKQGTCVVKDVMLCEIDQSKKKKKTDFNATGTMNSEFI